MRTRVKICGITNIEDARAAVGFGADALGFIFVPESPRYVKNYPDWYQIPDQIPPFVAPVAVHASFAASGWSAIHRGTPIKTLQYYTHGVESPSPIESFIGTRRLIHAFPMRNVSSLEQIAHEIAILRPHVLLLDTYHKDKLGGSGETFNWDLAIEAKQRFDLPIILAGGLTPENVGEAIAKVRPYAVDVSSGVEAEPGRKDHAKLKAFFEAVRQADAALK